MIGLEGTSTTIKVEQIRDLQAGIYRSPQLGRRTVVLIEPADALTLASANALLKLLEEPPSQAVFLLVARHLNALPATVLSRCQHYVFPDPFNASSQLPLTYAVSAEQDPERLALLEQRSQILKGLVDLIQGRQSLAELVALLKGHPLERCHWLLSLITSQALYCRLLQRQQDEVLALANLRSPQQWFAGWDQLNALGSDLRRNLGLNPSLALEVMVLACVAIIRCSDAIGWQKSHGMQTDQKNLLEHCNGSY